MVKVIILLYMVVVLAIGYWASKKTKNSDDFYAAGKGLGIIAISMASFSAAISGFVFVGGPGLFTKIGMGSLWLTLPTSASFAMAWIIMSKRMRLLAEAKECITAPDAMYARFGCNKTRLLATIATMVGLLLYLATQISALGFIIGPLFNIDFKVAVVIGMLIVVIYSVAGGMLAGVYTDVFQGAMMAIASIFIVIYAIKQGGGMGIMTDMIVGVDGGAKIVNPWGVISPMLAMSWFFVLGIGIVGQPHVIHKFYMVKDINKLRWGPAVAAIPAMLGGMFWIMIGYFIKAKASSGQLPPQALELLNSNADNTVVIFLNNYAPKVIAGMVYAGIVSAVMSTADSFINIVSACIVKDIPAVFNKKLDNKKELAYGRITVVILSILTILISFTAGTKGIAVLGAFGWGTFAAALAPAFGIGLNWKRATKQGAFWSILVGLCGNVIFEVGSKLGASWYVQYIKPLGIYNGALWMAISGIIFIGVSFMTSNEKIDDKVEACMDA